MLPKFLPRTYGECMVTFWSKRQKFGLYLSIKQEMSLYVVTHVPECIYSEKGEFSKSWGSWNCQMKTKTAVQHVLICFKIPPCLPVWLIERKEVEILTRTLTLGTRVMYRTQPFYPPCMVLWANTNRGNFGMVTLTSQTLPSISTLCQFV